jgi:hypothetical protein
MNTRGTHPNSLANLKAEKRWLDKSPTTTIRVPESLKSIILEVSHTLDDMKNQNPNLFKDLTSNEIGLLPKYLTYSRINEIIKYKKSMYESIKKLDSFLSTYMPRTEKCPPLLERKVSIASDTETN